MNLFEQSKQWHIEAKELIDKSKLLEILNNLGKVHFSGSYKYDLMLGPDIDLLLICQNPELTAKKLINTLIEQRFWNGYKFYDWDNFRSPKHPTYPKAYYVGLKGTHNEHRWKIDIWLVDKFPENIDDSWIIENLDRIKKKTILKLKNARNNSEFDSSSYDIYDAVINKNINSVGEFKNLLLQ
jgi:hypothetical protein